MRQTGVIASLALLARLAEAGLYPGITPLDHTCAITNPVLSCSERATPNQVDSCCSETFGGLVLQTQFWSVYTGLEKKGQVLPKDSWSIHGLWPDFCNGSYTQYCDLSRQYDPAPSPNKTSDGSPIPPYDGPRIDTFFKPYGKLDLLAYMNKYWINQNDLNWVLWAHEFSKHATCYSTFQKECYGPKAAKHDDLFSYFETAITFFRTLPTWTWLSHAHIHPSNSTSYTLSNIQAALNKGFGVLPYLGCSGPKYNETKAGAGSNDNGRTQLSEVWYYYHVQGRPQNGEGKRVPADIEGGSLSSCAKAKGAVWYYERARGSEGYY
ncbi:Fc.00g089100.m01.CDS01 [Cosmosporella sp. VM-42]